MFIEALEDRQMFSAPSQSVGEAQNFKVSIGTVRQASADDSAGATVVRGLGTGLTKIASGASTEMGAMGMQAGTSTLSQTSGLTNQMQTGGGTTTPAN